MTKATSLKVGDFVTLKSAPAAGEWQVIGLAKWKAASANKRPTWGTPTWTVTKYGYHIQSVANPNELQTHPRADLVCVGGIQDEELAA